MNKVTFKSRPVYITKTKTVPANEIIEFTEASEADIKLRAKALNWDLLSIEIVQGTKQGGR